LPRIWILFVVPTPTPTPDRRTARDLYQFRVDRITDEMKTSARGHGLRFHRAWFAEDGTSFYAVACWVTADGARAFFEEWDIQDEPGEIAIRLEGETGLATLAELVG
jgi:hypothetical protein